MLPGLSRFLQHHLGFTISINFNIRRSNRHQAAYPQRSLITPPGSVSYTPFRTIKYPITYSKYAVTDHIDILTVPKSFAAMAWHSRSNTVALPYHNMAASCWRLVTSLARRSTRVTLKIRAQIATVDRNLKSPVRENFPGYCSFKACSFPVF